MMKRFPSQKINAIFLLCDFPVKAAILSFPFFLFFPSLLTVAQSLKNVTQCLS